jgi:hypothetical protein
MRVRQIVDVKATSFYTSWNGLEINCGDNQVNVELTDDQYISLADVVNRKVERINQERLEKAQKAAEVDAE